MMCSEGLSRGNCHWELVKITNLKRENRVGQCEVYKIVKNGDYDTIHR